MKNAKTSVAKENTLGKGQKGRQRGVMQVCQQESPAQSLKETKPPKRRGTGRRKTEVEPELVQRGPRAKTKGIGREKKSFGAERKSLDRQQAHSAKLGALGKHPNMWEFRKRQQAKEIHCPRH